MMTCRHFTDSKMHTNSCLCCQHLPVVSCNTIVRCRSCRTYINPFVVFKGERRWECNLCFRVNELPEEFQYDPVSCHPLEGGREMLLIFNVYGSVHEAYWNVLLGLLKL